MKVSHQKRLLAALHPAFDFVDDVVNDAINEGAFDAEIELDARVDAARIAILSALVELRKARGTK